MGQSSLPAGDAFTTQPSQKKAYRRKKKFIYPEVQVKIILGILICGLFVLVLNLQLAFLGLWSVHSSGFATVEQALQEAKSMAIKEFLLSGVILIPLAIVMGITYSFRYCGPLYRFKKFLYEFPNGRWDESLNLRKDDHLQDMKDGINLCLDSLKDAIRSQHEVLTQVKAFLEGQETASRPEDARHLRELIAVQIEHFESKLGKDGDFPPESDLPALSPSPEEKQFTPA